MSRTAEILLKILQELKEIKNLLQQKAPAKRTAAK
jgi:hypothetical protein